MAISFFKVLEIGVKKFSGGFSIPQKVSQKVEAYSGPPQSSLPFEISKSFLRPHFHNEHTICDQQNVAHFSQKMQSDKYQVTLVITGVIQETSPGKTISGTRNSQVKRFIS